MILKLNLDTTHLNSEGVSRQISILQKALRDLEHERDRKRLQELERQNDEYDYGHNVQHSVTEFM